jgi:tetratricopeptide (TPR) repeat protein
LAAASEAGHLPEGPPVWICGDCHVGNLGPLALAAEKYAEAASLVASFDAESCRNWLLAQAGELYDQGDEFGDNAALADAISRYRQCLDLTPRARVPLLWAMTQNNLGNALQKLGERESGTGRLEEAVAAYRAALGSEGHRRRRDQIID